MPTMAEKRDYYEVLGVSPNATEKEIAEAYRRVALACHPDRNPGDEEAAARFREAAEAFEVLNNPEKRAIYDRYGHAGLEGREPQFRDISDIFAAFGGFFEEGFLEELFGSRRRRRRAHRGQDVRCTVTIDLLEAARGTTKTVEFDRFEECPQCYGSGARRGTRPETCSYCGGRGRVVQSAGFLSIQTTCPSCRGAGQVIRQACETCRGEGYVPRRVARQVHIPPGVDNDSELCLQGEGQPSPDGGPPGDCFCAIKVLSHPLFERRGQHLVCQVPISYSQAALGTTLEVPTLEGKEPLEIPAGTQHGDVFTLKGRGMPDPRYRGRGDLLVQVTIEVPQKLTREHENLLRQLAEIEVRQVSPKRKSFFEKIKEFFG
jgi:molecular chaperone DnaJ